MSLTREEYFSRVEDTAQTWLTESEAEDWCKENPDEDWQDFLNRDNGSTHDMLHGIVDGSCASEWRDAISVLEITEQNPDHVDPGLFEGCGWKRILVCIAFECFMWDVETKAEALFGAADFAGFLAPLPTNDRQIGHRPDIVRYRISKEAWTVDLHDGVKILDWPRMNHKEPPKLSVVFEGRVEKHRQYYIVYADRVYTQGDENANIKDDLERCLNEFMVERLEEEDDDDAEMQERDGVDGDD